MGLGYASTEPRLYIEDLHRRGKIKTYRVPRNFDPPNQPYSHFIAVYDIKPHPDPVQGLWLAFSFSNSGIQKSMRDGMISSSTMPGDLNIT